MLTDMCAHANITKLCHMHKDGGNIIQSVTNGMMTNAWLLLVIKTVISLTKDDIYQFTIRIRVNIDDTAHETLRVAEL